MKSQGLFSYQGLGWGASGRRLPPVDFADGSAASGAL